MWRIDTLFRFLESVPFWVGIGVVDDEIACGALAESDGGADEDERAGDGAEVCRPFGVDGVKCSENVADESPRNGFIV